METIVKATSDIHISLGELHLCLRAQHVIFGTDIVDDAMPVFNNAGFIRCDQRCRSMLPGADIVKSRF
eukprot:498837-Rhodomonas_salina.1